MDGREFSRHFTREAKKRGITPIPGRDTTTAEYAERVRSDKIELYRRLIREGNYREEFEGNEYNLRAYEMMTPQEILMSENREAEVRTKKTWDFILELRKFQEDSRKTIIYVD